MASIIYLFLTASGIGTATG
jgi:hypothetical protein